MLATIKGSTTRAWGFELYAPGDPSAPADYDVALVKLGASLPAPNGHAEPFETRLYAGSSSSLVGNRYYCQGWGYNSCSNQNIGLRSANLTVASADGGGFTITPNGLGQIQTLGDSGGSCYQVVSGRYHVLGILSAASCGNWAAFTGAVLVRDWVDSVIDRVGVLDGRLGHSWSKRAD